MATNLGDRRVDPGLSRNRPHGNIAVLRVAVVVLFGILAIRLVDMQIIHGSEFAQRAEENRILIDPVLPARGLVYDRNGEPLVENTGVFAAVVTPSFLPDDDLDRYRLFLYLEDLLAVPALEIQDAVDGAVEAGRADTPLVVARNLDRERALMLDQAAVDLPGVELSVEPGRRYPAGNEFAHILGYIGQQTPEEWAILQDEGYAFNELVGKTGVEAEYETWLRGLPGAATTEVNAQGDPIEVLERDEPEPGQSLGLAIDADLQRFVTNLMEQTMGDARVAAAVVMSPISGEVYSLVSLPSYDNNIFSAVNQRQEEYRQLLADPRKPLLNQALSPTAPGSTFKLITAAAGLEVGNITPETGLDVSSDTLEFIGEDGQIYYFYDWAVHGYVNLYSGIARSSNLYFNMVACGIPYGSGLGKDIEQSAVTLGYYARSFGLGKVTGVDLVTGEAPGTVPSPEWKRRTRAGDQFNPEDREWYLADTCFMGIGQGDVTATPLQIALMTSAVANGGYLLEPHVVNAILDADGEVVREIEPEWERVPVSEENLAHVRRGMEESVTYGAANRAANSITCVAGKTGTAEFVEDGVTKEHAWFTGYAPCHDPQVVVTVYFDLGVGGNKAAPVGGRIIDYFMANVTP